MISQFIRISMMKIEKIEKINEIQSFSSFSFKGIFHVTFILLDLNTQVIKIDLQKIGRYFRIAFSFCKQILVKNKYFLEKYLEKNSKLD